MPRAGTSQQALVVNLQAQCTSRRTGQQHGRWLLPSVESGQVCTCVPTRHPGLEMIISIARGVLLLDKNGDQESHSAEATVIPPDIPPSSQRLIDIDLGRESLPLSSVS